MKAPRNFRTWGYDPALLPNAQLRKLEKGVHDLETARTRSGLTIGYPGWGILYYVLLAHLHPDEFNVIIETGTNVGCSTIILAQALKDSGRRGRVFTIEIGAQEHAAARQNIEAAGLSSLVELYHGDAATVLPEILAHQRVVRFAFLDGSHLVDQVLTEFESLLPRLAADAIVAFDNTWGIADAGEDPRVNGALKLIRERHGGNLINLPYVSWFTTGLAFWQRQPDL